MFDMRFCASVGRDVVPWAAGPVGGLNGFDPREGETPAEDELAALGPVGMPPGLCWGAVGEAEDPGMCRGGMAGQPPRPPREAYPPLGGT